MRTHRRAWWIRAGVVMVVTAWGLLGLAVPAQAATNPQITDLTVDPGSIAPGQQATVKFKVRNTGEAGVITVEVSADNAKLTCSGQCKSVNVSFDAKDTSGATKDYAAKFAAGGSFTQDEQATITVRAAAGTGATAQEQQTVTVVVPKPPAPTAAPTVPEVSGTVVDISTGKPVENAQVFIQDSANHNWETGTNKAGEFKIQSRPERPIAPGTIAFQVERTGFQPFSGITRPGVAGQALAGVKLNITPVASATPSAGALAPSQEASGISPIEERTNVAIADEGGNGLSWVLIAVGGLLVALGVGAIVLLFVRRKDEADGPDGDPRKESLDGGPPGPPGHGGRRPAPAQQRWGAPPEATQQMRIGPGGYDPTRPIRPPAAAGQRGDQTVIAPSPLANAPTQVHSRVADPADPYGAPSSRYPGGQPGFGPNAYGQPGSHGQPPPPGYAAGSPTMAFPGGAPSAYGPGGPGPARPGPAGPAGPAGSPPGPAVPGQLYSPGTDPYGSTMPGYPGGSAPGSPGVPPAGPTPHLGHPAGPPDPRGTRGSAVPPPPSSEPRRVDWVDE